VKFKLSTGQKLLVLIAAILLITGAGRLIFFQIRPFEVVQFGIDRLINSAGYEQDIRVACQADAAHWQNPNISADMLNDLYITAHYSKDGDRSGIDFSLNSSSTQETVISGRYYSDQTLSALMINDKTFYSKSGKPPILSDGPAHGFDAYGPYVRYQPGGGAVLPVNDYGKPAYMVMDAFSLSLEGDTCAGLLNTLISGADNNNGIYAYAKDIPMDSVTSINAVFQIDDFFKLRGIHAEIGLPQASIIADLNTARVGGKIDLPVPDITNGTDIGNYSKDEIGALFKELFDSLAGGK